MERTDVILVGAGPIGIELAVALRREGFDYRHLEADQVGSTIAWYAPFTRFFSSPERIAIAGVPLQTIDQGKATREEYLAYLRSVVQQFELEIRTGERVEEVERGADGSFLVRTDRQGQERRLEGKRLVLAIGDMHRPRLLGIPGEDLPHVSHYLEEPHVYFRRRVLVVGGKNSAVEAAIRCRRIGAEVILSYRGDELDADRIKYWLMPEIRALIRDGGIEFLPRTVPRQILPDRVILERRAPGSEPDADGEALEIAADQVLLLTGYEQDPALFRAVGLDLEGPGRRPVLDEATMESSVPGVYVAGTAVAGTQLGGVQHFIETSHVHVERIVAALAGRRADAEAPTYELPES